MKYRWVCSWIESQNFEPINPDIGLGFHLEHPETFSYPLAPRGTTIIPLSVMSSMWGKYHDLLQLQVTIRILSVDHSAAPFRSRVSTQSKRFPCECRSLVIRSKHTSVPIRITNPLPYPWSNSGPCSTIHCRSRRKFTCKISLTFRSGSIGLSTISMTMSSRNRPWLNWSLSLITTHSTLSKVKSSVMETETSSRLKQRCPPVSDETPSEGDTSSGLFRN